MSIILPISNICKHLAVGVLLQSKHIAISNFRTLAKVDPNVKVRMKIISFYQEGGNLGTFKIVIKFVGLWPHKHFKVKGFSRGENKLPFSSRLIDLFYLKPKLFLRTPFFTLSLFFNATRFSYLQFWNSLKYFKILG